MFDLSKILNIYKSSDLDSFIKELTGHTLNEKNLKYVDISSHRKFLGNNSSNGSSVNILKRGEKGIIERLTNAIDAVIEKQKIKHNISSASKATTIIEKAFPKYYENFINLSKGSCKIQTYDAADQVILAANDATGTTKITFDIIDQGTGITGTDFPKTILSLNAGNKLSREKSYLIGAFGQGGSTSLPFTYATIIISKKNHHCYFSIIKEVDLSDYKNSCYVYLTIDNEIPEAELKNSQKINYNYLETFLNSESGTLIRMIETDISLYPAFLGIEVSGRTVVENNGQYTITYQLQLINSANVEVTSVMYNNENITENMQIIISGADRNALINLKNIKINTN